MKVEEVKRRQHCLMFSSAGSQAQTYFVNFDTLAEFQRWQRQASKVSSRTPPEVALGIQMRIPPPPPPHRSNIADFHTPPAVPDATSLFILFGYTSAASGRQRWLHSLLLHQSLLVESLKQTSYVCVWAHRDGT